MNGDTGDFQPLADRMRPRDLDAFIGQEKIVGEGRLLRRAIQADQLTSSIFWGPPGTGKTTLAFIIAHATRSAFARMNAVTSGVADVREVLKEADTRQRLLNQATYLLLDECHRWSKAQSDSILQAIEQGIIRFVGSTTENPMIAMTPAIISRCRLFEFEQLSQADIELAVTRAIRDCERGYGKLNIHIASEALRHIAQVAGGDVRSALNALELAVLTTPFNAGGHISITREIAEESIQKRVLRCDESMYYDMISAFIKSMRGSDPDAALAWFARLIYAGVDPRIIVRRLIVHASEDVGLANPLALLQAVAASHALEAVGMPEARIPIAQAIIAVSESPKSNSVVNAIAAAAADAQKGGFQPVPQHLRDTSYKGHERIQSGLGYKYPHDYPGHYVKQQYAPLESSGMPYYMPGSQGQEAKIAERRKMRHMGNG
jgi:putative ATPase